jgi:hypothetical protein
VTRLFMRDFSLQVDTLEIRELNVAFAIERTLRRRPGRAEIKIWNLSATHRHQLEQLTPGHVFVEFRAGYVEQTSLLFRGELHEARSERSGADIVTTVRSRDGGGAHSARVSRSHRPGASFGAVVRGVISAMGIGEGNLGDFLPTATMGGVGVFANGATTSGSAADELDRLMSSADLEWSVQEGALQVLQRGRALQRTAIRLATETGMLESPSREKDGKIKVRTLLIPDLVPGRLVQIESADIVGTYRVEQAAYRGEFDGGDWGIEITCGAPNAARRAA